MAATITLLWYFVLGFGEKSGNNMYGWNYFKWCYYFLFMLLGSMMGLKRNLNKKHIRFSKDYMTNTSILSQSF